VSEWYEDLFDDRYLIYYEDALLGGASADEIDFIERALALEAGSSILDLGCGFGRHSIPLALRGYRVTGTDLSTPLLKAAETIGERLGAGVEWIKRDLRELSGLGPYDACVCLYTVFGYCSDEENAGVLAGVRDLLRPDGLLLLDLDNPLCLVPHLPRENWGETTRGVRRERHEYDPLSARVSSTRTLIARDGSRMTLPRSSVRLYYPHEIARLLREAGFAIEQVHGGLQGARLDWRRSPMQSWVARRV
jgi:SAM-dependent methyltransferase